MNTKILMVSCSFLLAVAGAAASFAPDELLGALQASATAPVPALVQLLGGLYFAFAIANWTAKDNLIGGIYARPLSLGNFVHFLMGTLALAKYQAAHGFRGLLLGGLIAYGIFALAFGYLVFGQGTACKIDRQPPAN